MQTFLRGSTKAWKLVFATLVCFDFGMASASVLSSRLAAPHVFLGKCTKCSTPLEYLPPAGPSRSPQTYQVRCFSCGTVLTHTISDRAQAKDNARPEHTPPPSSSAKKGGRKIGTDERPLVRFVGGDCQTLAPDVWGGASNRIPIIMISLVCQ